MNLLLTLLSPARIISFVKAFTNALEKYAEAEARKADLLRKAAAKLEQEAGDADKEATEASAFASRLRNTLQ